MTTFDLMGLFVLVGYLTVAGIETWRLHRSRRLRFYRLAVIAVAVAWATWYVVLILGDLEVTGRFQAIGRALQVGTVGVFLIVGHMWETLIRRR